jgi:NAD(P)-dependent dehydrogenase (short-subunit alcohol dehydrogenase family)
VADSASAEFLTSLFSLNGKVAVVIGGTGELCGAMAEGLAGAGAEVVLVGRNEDKAKARLLKIAAAGGNGWFYAAEATSRADLEGLLAAVLRRSGRVDSSSTGPVSTRRRRFSRLPKTSSIGSFASIGKASSSVARYSANTWSRRDTAGRLSTSDRCRV